MLKNVIQIKDKTGRIMVISKFKPWMTESVMNLFREGYPDSFDGNDLRQIKKILRERPIRQTFLVAIAPVNTDAKICACFTGFEPISGLHRVYEGGYGYTLKEFRHSGVQTMLEGVAEELVTKEARLVLAVNAGLLPKEVLSFGWFKAIGFSLLGEVKYWFRDDLSGLFLGKRNPYFPIGKGIPKNSGWDETMADSKTGELVSEKKYNRIMNDPGLAPKEKWGLDLIGRENVISFNE